MSETENPDHLRLLAGRAITLFDQHLLATKANADDLAPAIARAARKIIEALLAGHKILACGNGASAAIVSLFTTMLINRFEHERPGLPAINLSSDGATLSAIAGDYHVDETFAKPLRAISGAGDLLLISTSSGNTGNLVHAAVAAKERGLDVITLNANDGGELSTVLDEHDVDIRVHAASSARIIEMHVLIVHCLCDLVDHQLLGQP